ncbi:MAG: deoxyribose-phosphate aldolase [Candidatus Bipolaricaulota bacterium]|nr:deoxyribose-phosphate aldolase [Candidatus Bipolaricaulota bacterium]
MNRRELASRIDHTLLGPTASRDGVRKLCAEAVRYGTASVCVSPCHAALAKELLHGSAVKLCVVIGFPHGATTAAAKRCEADEAIALGADELDMVIRVDALKEGDEKTVSDDIRAVCAAARKAPREVLVKTILETCLLSEEEKTAGARIAKEAGADYVKTSTGFSTGGATAADVALLRRVVGPEMGVKASGGIRDTKSALEMIAAGASRIGASRTVDIVEGVAEE